MGPDRYDVGRMAEEYYLSSVLSLLCPRVVASLYPLSEGIWRESNGSRILVNKSARHKACT
jgi:hypothetical protein